MQDTYHFFTVEDVQKDEKEIFKVLQGILDGRLSNDLKVLNYYKEIPVSYDAKILHMDEDLLEGTTNFSHCSWNFRKSQFHVYCIFSMMADDISWSSSLNLAIFFSHNKDENLP